MSGKLLQGHLAETGWDAKEGPVDLAGPLDQEDPLGLAVPSPLGCLCHLWDPGVQKVPAFRGAQ